MSSAVLVLLASLSCAFSSRIPKYSQQNAALGYFYRQQYSHYPKSVPEDLQKFDNLVNQRNAIQSQISWPDPRNEVAAPSSGSGGYWVWVSGSGPFTCACNSAVQSGSNALAASITNSGIQSTQISFSGADARGFNSHQGTNRGPSNYNGYFSRASSPKKQSVLIQGAVSSVGDTGSIYVPGD